MRRLVAFAVLLAAVSTVAYADERPTPASDAATAAPAKPRPRNAFSQALADLTRAAREQHEAEAKGTQGVTPAAATSKAAHAATTDAPVLADSNGR